MYIGISADIRHMLFLIVKQLLVCDNVQAQSVVHCTTYGDCVSRLEDLLKLSFGDVLAVKAADRSSAVNFFKCVHNSYISFFIY